MDGWHRRHGQRRLGRGNLLIMGPNVTPDLGFLDVDTPAERQPRAWLYY